jgi:hypothetical protein
MAKQAKQIIEATANKAPTTTAPTPTVVPTAPASPMLHDGFDTPDEGGSGSIIRGMKVKFTKGAEWIDRDKVVIDPARQFFVAEIKKVVQQWLPGADRPETRELGPDEFFPDIEKMNAEAPRSEWRTAFGEQQGPYEAAYVLYLFDPRTMEAFTFITPTTGGHRAVDDLKGKVRRARMLQGANRYALVTLGDTHMNTRYGGLQRPDFKVLDYVPLGGPAKPLLEPAKPRLSLRDEMDDGLPEGM